MQQQLLNFCRYGFLLLALSFTACEPEDDDFFDFREPTNLVFADALTIDAGESIAYRDESVGATGWDWTFEGGDPATSAEQTPTVTYPGEGSFLVTLITTYNDGSTTRRNLFPTVLPQIVADFSVESQQNVADSPIKFSNLTVGAGTIPDPLSPADTFILYEWTFEGGTPATSTESNPTVTYANVGTYNVTLKVTRLQTDFVSEITREDFIEIVDVPILDVRTAKFNRDDSQILVMANEPFATPTAATAAAFTLTDGSGGTVAFTGASLAAYSPSTLVLEFDRSQLSAGEYTLDFSGSDVAFASGSILGAFSRTLRFAGDINWATIIYDMNGNLTDREVDLGNGKTLLWSSAGSPFSFGTDPSLNIFSPTAAGFQSIGFRNVDSGVDYVITANPGPNTTYDDVRAVGMEYYRIGPPGTVLNFNTPVTDFIAHTDGIAVTIAPNGLSAEVTQNDPGRQENVRMTFILEDPAAVGNLILSHTAPQNQNVYVTTAGF